MTDDFNRIAKMEIDESISSLEKIDSILNDSLTSSELEKISKNLHEIKGLAPMIDQTNVTTIASLLYKVIEIHKEKPGVLESKIIHESIVAIRSIFNEEIKEEEVIENRLKEILNY